MNLSDLQKIKEQVSIRDVAESLLHLEKQDGKYKYPGERTASIQLYTDAQSFNDTLCSFVFIILSPRIRFVLLTVYCLQV